MRAVLIDDEKNALDALDDLLTDSGFVTVAAKYTNPLAALEQIERLSCNVVFLDIEMPGTGGLEAADRIMELRPDVEIVFVTAYDQYAVEAFELNALDYLLKPVRAERLAKTVDRLRSRIQTDGSAAEHKAFIQCFNTFQLKLLPEDAEQVKWRTNKVKELFAYFVHHAGEPVHRSRIIEELWPDAQLDKANAYLHTSIYQIRKMIKDSGLESCLKVRYKDQSYKMECSGIGSDIDIFMSVVQDETPIEEANVSKFEQAAKVYKGGYLEHEDYPWSLKKKAELLLLYNELVERLVLYYISAEAYSQAVRLLIEALQLNPLTERLHELLLKTYAAMGDRPAIVQHFKAMEQLFLQEVGIGPGPSVASLYNMLCHGG